MSMRCFKRESKVLVGLAGHRANVYTGISLIATITDANIW